MLEILAAIEAPVLAILAEPLSRYISEEMIAGRSQAVKRLDQVRLGGHHHFHMDQAPETAALIREFLDKNETTQP